VARPKATRRRLLEFALDLPGAWLDHPWDEDVAKAGKKVFAFFGHEDYEPFVGMTVKLDDSRDQALAAPGAEPSGYGLGKWGWVSIPFVDGTPPLDVLQDWIEESYRRIAPKDLVRELDRQHGGD
jgi:predicted DNA-binding protein (MmcQ/YjbR family)